MNDKIRDNYTDFLFSAILKLESLDECYAFFEDLCTIPELKAMSQRIVVAHMLKEDKVYSDIVSKTKASTATISRVNRSIRYGCEGYALVFDRLSEEEKKLAEHEKSEEEQ